MIGWEIFITLELDGREKTLAVLRGSYDACTWIESLVKAGMAVDEGGSGYPNRWLSSLGAVMPFIKSGRYLYPNDLDYDLRVSDAALTGLPQDTAVVIEAWDQS
jgi:hypothetical protein